MEISGFVLSIIGNIVTSLIIAWYLLLRDFLKRKKIRIIFGEDFSPKAQEPYRVVYCELVLREVIQNFIRNSVDSPHMPYARPDSATSKNNYIFSASSLVPISEARGANYLSVLFTRYKAKFENTTELPLDGKSNISRVSLGSRYSNTLTGETEDAFGLVKLKNHDSYVGKAGNKELNLHGRPTEDIDFGVIIRVRNPSTKKVWLACEGIGEWGTSGTAWYLANCWKTLAKASRSWWNPFPFGGGRDFAALFSVVKGRDDTAKLIGIIKSENDVEALSQKAIQAG